MRKKIAILGSTGSIGKTTVDIIKKDKKNFEVILLTSNNNYQELIKQTKELNVKNLIIPFGTTVQLERNDFMVDYKSPLYDLYIQLNNSDSAVDVIINSKK